MVAGQPGPSPSDVGWSLRLHLAASALNLQPVEVGVPRYCVDDTRTTALPHLQTGLSWGRQVEETTLNGCTMTSLTLPEEKKFWVRK